MESQNEALFGLLASTQVPNMSPSLRASGSQSLGLPEFRNLAFFVVAPTMGALLICGRS